MKFDPTKDICRKEVAKIPTKDTEEVIIGIYSYNEGELKIGATRHGTSVKGTEYHASLGRMTFEEAQKVIPELVRALEMLDNL